MLKLFSKYGVFVLAILFMGLYSLFGQVENTYSFVNYSNKDGFNQNTVLSIEQDKYGILWLGTSNGLIKYDGNSFQNVSWEPEHQSDIYHGPISNILSDSRGLLWITSRTGLNIYYPHKEQFFKVTSDSLDMLYRCVEDSDSSIWVLGNKFLSNVRAGISNDSIILSWSPNLLTGAYAKLDILDFLKVNDIYLLATSTGLFRMSFPDGSMKPVFEAENIIPSGTIRCLKLHNKNIVWLGTESGLYKTVLAGNILTYLNTYQHNDSDPTSLAHNHVMDLLIGDDNRLWVGTWLGGLSLYHEKDDSFTNFTHDSRKKGVISGNMINCLYEDPFNVLWIGTAQAGLNKLDLSRKQFTNLEHDPYDDNTIPANLINCILEDRKGYLWVSTYNSPLCRSKEPVSASNLANLGFDRFDSFFSSFPHKNIVFLHEDKKGYIWLGYENAVVVYNPGTRSFSRVITESDDPELPNPDGRYILSIDHDKIMMVGTSIIILKHPWRYLGSQEEAHIPVYASYPLEEGQILTTVNAENPSHIWVGYLNSGLSRFGLEGDSLYLMNHHEYVENDETSISNNAVFCINQDRDQRLWVGTFGGGLNRLIDLPGSIDQGFERLRDTIGLADNAFYGIIEENDSILWCATDMGISRLNTRSFETTSYNMYDGLPSNNFRQNAYHRGQSGYYYFGGLNGLTAFKPEHIGINLIPPEIRITELKINNRAVPVGERVGNRVILNKHISEESELVLTRDDQTVSFGLTVYHTSTPEKNRLSYILEGFDKEWIDIKQGSFSPTYTNLTPGDYTFRVRGYNCDGIVSEEEAALQISMLAPWFARPISKILFVLLALSVLSGVSLYVVKVQNLQNTLHFEKIDKERIKDLNQSKLRFFTNISHEFKTPLSLISIPLQKLQEIVKGDEEREYVDMIEKNSNRLIRLIDQLLTFRRIEHGGLVLKVSQCSIDGFIYPVADAFESLSIKKGIQFYYQVKDPAFMVHLDLEKMEQVLFNLLSNAFKFTPPNGKVRLEGGIRTLEGRKFVYFDVKDSGVGIQVEDMDKIFDRFYQSGSELTNMGTGIGLSYSKSIVELHKGVIEVESTPGKGTRFSVMLPLNELQAGDHGKKEVRRLNASELLEYEAITSNMAPADDSKNKHKHTVLIADDEYEFRGIIKNVLQKNYRIREASNGTEALEIATSGEVDLIISDVMMPGMNGYDFCKKVKSDMQLCHIPFILLTALEEMDSHIQGVEHGADSYMSKPFNLKYLEASVQNLIENREKLKEHFTRSHTLPADVQISGIDTEFIETVNKAIQENVDDSTFGVEELAREANLSTSQLYRKLKLLTGQIPNAYLRNYRLQAAADLLSGNPGISVKSVMYEVGFESASHFSHAFKKKYGYSPSEFS